MNEDFRQITQFYQILNESPPDPQRIEEASKYLIDFYSHPESFSLIVSYISSIQDPALQKAAIVGVKKIIENNSDLLQDQETYLSLLNLSIIQSSYVRKLAIDYLSLFQSPAELVFQFVQSLFNPTTEDNINNIQIETCMKLMTNILKNAEEEEAVEYIELCSALSAKAFESSNIDLLISGAILRLTFIPFIQYDQETIYQEYMSSSFQVLYQLIEQKSDSDQTDDLIRTISSFIYNNSDSVEYQSLLEVIINNISSPDISQNLSEQLLLLSNNILKSCKYVIKEQENPIELILQLLNTYIIYAKKTYDPSNSYDLCNNLIFSTFFKVFYEEQYISEIYSNISSLFDEDSSGKFVTLLILDSSFESSSDFYHLKVNEIINIFQISLSCEDLCVRSTASLAISDFCLYLRPTAKFDSIITSLFECISNSPSLEFLNSLTDIFDITTRSDTFFDQSLNFLFQLFEATGDILFRQRIFSCISSLTKSSNERVCAFFDQVFSAMSQIVQNASSDEQVQSLLPFALSCLSHLCFTCKEKMESFAPSLLDSAAQWISEDFCQSECIKALSAVCQNFPQNAHETAPQILKALFDLASKKIEWEDIDQLGDEDDDDEDFTFKDQFVSISNALLCICTVLSIYPDLLVQHFDELFDLLLNFKENPTVFGTVACASGANLVAKALIDIDGSDEQESRLITKILLPLAKGSDYKTSGAGFLGLSTALMKGRNFVSKEIFDAILMALNGHLFFQHEEISYNENLFEGILHLLKTLMKLNFFDELQEFIPVIQEYLSKSEGLRDFALKFFASFISISKGLQNLKEELVSAVAQVAMEVTDGYASIEFLTKLTETVPDSISEMVPKIIELVSSRVFESGDDDVTIVKSDQILIEKSILLLRSLLKKTGADISLFFPLIINSTPPIILLRKSGKFFELIQWISKNQDGELNTQIAAAAIKLFSEPESLIEKRNLNQEEINQIKSLLQSLSASIPNFSEFCTETCENDEFKMSNLNNHVFES